MRFPRSRRTRPVWACPPLKKSLATITVSKPGSGASDFGDYIAEDRLQDVVSDIFEIIDDKNLHVESKVGKYSMFATENRYQGMLIVSRA